MKSTFTEDQGQLLKAITDSVKPEVIALQDRRQIVVVKGQVVETALPRVRPALSQLSVSTLTSFADMVKRNSDVIVRIDSPSQVVAIDIREPELHQVVILARADLRVPTILSHYVSLETALIEIRECFEQTTLIEQLSDTLRTTKIEDITELTDNGMGMNVSVRSRVINGKNADTTAFNLELIPIRTFYEVDDVPGVFTMRWKREGAEIKVRLIEQVVHKWRYNQMEKIAAYLEELLPEATILM